MRINTQGKYSGYHTYTRTHTHEYTCLTFIMSLITSYKKNIISYLMVQGNLISELFI